MGTSTSDPGDFIAFIVSFAVNLLRNADYSAGEYDFFPYIVILVLF